MKSSINASLIIVASVATTASAFSSLSASSPSKSIINTATSKNHPSAFFVRSRRRHVGSLAATSLNDDDSSTTDAFDPFNISDGGRISDTSHVVRAHDATTAAASSTSTESQGGLGDVWKARLLLIVAAALYGTNFTCVKLLDDSVPVGISTTLRFALAALATLPWLLAPAAQSTPNDVDTDGSMSRAANDMLSDASKAMDDTRLPAIIAGLEVGAYNSVGYISQAIGLETTDASKSAFICSLAVVIVPILDFLAGKKLLPREIVGAAMAVAGVGFLELGGADAVQSVSTGDLITLMQPLAFGVAFWRMERACDKFPEEAKRLTAAQIFAVFVSSAAYTQFFSGDHSTMTQIVDWVSDPMILGAIFWTGCITTALTLYMETLALKTLSAAETTMIFSTEPLWGAAFASAVVGEKLGLGAGVGAALILGGCLFGNMGNFDWIKGLQGANGSAADCDTDSNDDNTDQSQPRSLPKALVGPGLSFATPAVAVAKVAADLANDPSASAIGDAVQDTLGDM